MIGLLALLSAAASPALPPITEDEVIKRSGACIALYNATTPEERNRVVANIMTIFNLDTAQKERDFAIGCLQLKLGIQIGVEESNKLVIKGNGTSI